MGCICCPSLGRRKKSEGRSAAVTSVAKLVISNLVYFSPLQWRRSLSPGDYVHQLTESHPELLSGTVAEASAVLFIFNRITSVAKAFPSGACSFIFRGHQPLLPLSEGASCFISRPLFLVSANDPWKLIGSALSEISIRLILPREKKVSELQRSRKKDDRDERGEALAGACWITFYLWRDGIRTWSDSNGCYICLCVCKVLACVSTWTGLWSSWSHSSCIFCHQIGNTMFSWSLASTIVLSITHLVVQGHDRGSGPQWTVGYTCSTADKAHNHHCKKKQQTT